VVVRTERFDEDLRVLLDELGFRVDAIHPADAPVTAIVSGHGVRLRLEASATAQPATIHLVSDDPGRVAHLPGGSRLEWVPFDRPYVLPDNAPSLAVSRNGGGSGVGRAGMRYRDLIPDRWGGRFIASHITIPDGGPVPDYVHFHKIRFQLIFVKSGWVRLVYEDQGEPFVMHAGDAVLQPPEIRHRVLESSPGLEVIEVGCPAEHETIADWSMELPTGAGDPDRRWDGQRFVRHVARDAPWTPWRIAGWEHRDTGIGDATAGLAGVRVARPTPSVDGDVDRTAHDAELLLLVVLAGEVTFEHDGEGMRLGDADSVAVPPHLVHRLVDPTPDCELLEVTLPATPAFD
jgi:quercetin dioxygenase-like cupin family protein